MKYFSILVGCFFYSFCSGQTTLKYQYDNLNRLTHISLAPCKYIQYQYDAEGNRISQQQVSFLVKDSVVRPCFAQTNGKIYIAPVLPNSRYRYTWSNGQSGSSVVNIANGAYGVSIYDSSSNSTCQLNYNIVQFANDSFQIVKQNIPCKGFRNGSVRVIKSPLTVGTFNYSWSNGSRDSILTNLPATQLTLTITNLQTGCQKNYAVEISEPKEEVVVFPNPTTATTTIEFCSEISNQMDVSIFTIGGQLLKQYTKPIQALSNRETFNFSNYPPGIYLIRLTFGDQVKSAKIVKL